MSAPPPKVHVVPTPEGEGVLISWISVGERHQPLLGALDEPSPLYNKIQHLYLCWRNGPVAVGRKPEKEILEETRSTLHARLDRFCPILHNECWETEAAPIEHGEIRPFAEKVLKKVRQKHPKAHIYIHLSPGTPAMHAIWLLLGATGFVDGPMTLIQGTKAEERRPGQSPIERVPIEVDSLLRRFRASKPGGAGGEDSGVLWEPRELAQESPLRAVLETLDAWAALRAPVLLIGARGTGKTTLANYLRAMGPFQKRGQGSQWPSVVCGQFRGDRQHARSELFGHKKGAFTGAERDQEGLLEVADGDCLFLDEIADIDRDTQRLLMAALEGRGFQRLGDTQRRFSRFRLISATNRSMKGLKELLDLDFFDRIAVCTIRVPSLHECRDDIPLLWGKVLRRIAAEADVAGWESWIEQPELLEVFAQHALPGNLRDLERAAWHLLPALTVGASQEITLQRALQALPAPPVPTDIPDEEWMLAQLPLAIPLRKRLDHLQDAWVQAALHKAGGNQSEAARLLGEKRETLKSWMKS